MTSMRDGSSTSEAPYSWRSFFHLFLDSRDGLRRKGGIADLLFMSLCFRPWTVMLLRCKLPSLEEVGNYKKIKGHTGLSGRLFLIINIIKALKNYLFTRKDCLVVPKKQRTNVSFQYK